ncbi:MAG: DUF116 domain-containing protein [bacterium]|nr:DUF116 domain-containing protein [bacterium]
MKHRAPTYRLGPEFDRKLEEFRRKFLKEGFSLFAEEFSGLDTFIANAHQDRSDRQDKGLRRTPREKYLLEALSYKMYDELNREAFNRTKDTLIVLPDCLSLDNPDCLKTDEAWGDRCQQCNPECEAFDVSELADRYGLEVVYSKRKLSEQIDHYADRSGDLAVVGVACLLMLAPGMRAAADVGVPARGVLLNFTGCEHWNDETFASRFPLEQLEAILEEKYGQVDQKADN